MIYGKKRKSKEITIILLFLNLFQELLLIYSFQTLLLSDLYDSQDGLSDQVA